MDSQKPKADLNELNDSDEEFNDEDDDDSALDLSSSFGEQEKLYENLPNIQRTSLSTELHAGTEELRVLLLGARGSGKSSTGNAILGCHAFNTDMQLSRVTHFCERAAGRINSRPVAVIDTPGLNRIGRTEREVTREILKSISLYTPGPHVFLLVMPVGNLSNDDKSMHKLVESMFGKSVWKYTIIVFTHRDRLGGKTPNDVIACSDKELRKFLHKCSGGFVFLDNRDAGNHENVAELLQKIDTLVAINGNGCYAASLYPRWERKIRMKMEKILESRRPEIARQEERLEALCADERELERQKRQMWRAEEDEARKQAESPSNRKCPSN